MSRRIDVFFMKQYNFHLCIYLNGRSYVPGLIASQSAIVYGLKWAWDKWAPFALNEVYLVFSLSNKYFQICRNPKIGIVH